MYPPVSPTAILSLFEVGDIIFKQSDSVYIITEKKFYSLQDLGKMRLMKKFSSISYETWYYKLKGVVQRKDQGCHFISHLWQAEYDMVNVITLGSMKVQRVKKDQCSM